MSEKRFLGNKMKFAPLLVLLVIGISAGAGAVTLWMVGLTGSVTLAASPYRTLIFSDDVCTIPCSTLNFGTVTATYGGPSSSEWITVTLQIQTPVPAGVKLFISQGLTGSLPVGAVLEIQRQRSTDLSWIPETIVDRGFFGNNGVTVSPLIGGLQIQRWRYRLVFSVGSPVGQFTNFGLEYTVSDI
jgi:hypothetical protein